MRVLVLVALLAARVAAADQASTGTVAAPASPSSALHFGGDAPRFVLYLRTDGPLGEPGRAALATALGALARIPGAAVDVYFDPSDREAAPLVGALLALPDEAARRALLVALLEQDLPRWSDGTGMYRLARSAGLSLPATRLGRGGSPAARLLLRRPPGTTFADRSYCALGDRLLTPADLDPLAEAEVWPVRARHTVSPQALAAGDPLAPYVVSLRFTLPFSIAGRDSLRAALDAHDRLRARLRLEVVPLIGADEAEGIAVLARAFDHADPEQRLALARTFIESALPQNEATAVWLIQRAGLDPAPLLAGGDPGPHTVRPEDTASFSVVVDGASPYASALGPALQRARLPSLRERLEHSSR